MDLDKKQSTIFFFAGRIEHSFPKAPKIERHGIYQTTGISSCLLFVAIFIVHAAAPVLPHGRSLLPSPTSSFHYVMIN